MASQPAGELSGDPVQMRSIAVSPGRLACEVAIPDERFRYTTPELAAYVAAAFPELGSHACVNGVGQTFGAVMGQTPMPHLAEHLAISLQTRAADDAGASFVGVSEWMDEAAGIARIELSFRDDLEALRAFAEAIQFLNTAVLTCLA